MPNQSARASGVERGNCAHVILVCTVFCHRGSTLGALNERSRRSIAWQQLPWKRPFGRQSGGGRKREGEEENISVDIFFAGVLSSPRAPNKPVRPESGRGSAARAPRESRLPRRLQMEYLPTVISVYRNTPTGCDAGIKKRN